MIPPDRYPKTIVLTDGAHLRLCRASGADAPGGASAEAGQPMGSVDSPVLVVLACDGPHVAGEMRLRRDATSPDDAVVVDMVLDPAYRGRRLGTWMLLESVHAAEHLGATRLVAEVEEGDGAFESALVRLDFIEEASSRERHRPSRGRAGAVRRMTKRLHRGWTDF